MSWGMIAGSVLLAVIGLTACQRPAETASPSISMVPTSPLAPAAPSKEQAEPSHEQASAWNEGFLSDCAKGDGMVHKLVADISGDGETDKICWRAFHSEDAGDWLQVQFSVKGREIHALFPASGSTQLGIGSMANLRVEVRKWNADWNYEYGFDKSPGPIGVIFSDQETDPLWLFWHDDGAGNPTMTSARH